MSEGMAPNSALELFREEFAEALQGAMADREMGEDPIASFLKLSDAFEKVAKAELAQWVNIIAELGYRVGDGLGELPKDLAEAVSVTTDVLLDTSHLGLDFLAANSRIVSAASTALAWCALASADSETAQYIVLKHPGALTAALEILDDATGVING
jgi:hypothetical protein